jgi:hypothetical protein
MKLLVMKGNSKFGTLESSNKETAFFPQKVKTTTMINLILCISRKKKN